MLKLTELYPSTQGEGPHTGEKTLFIRFAGCNMRCPGWPCDTPFSIFPDQIRLNSEKFSADDLAVQVCKKADQYGITNLCYTGGEPFIQSNNDLAQMTRLLLQQDYHIECFSNGSFLYPDWALDHLQFMMDWKLPGSGEASTNILERERNALLLKETDGIKFVVKDQSDLDVAVGITTNLKNEGCAAQLWCGSAWGEISEAAIVEFILEHSLPWRLNVQVHKYVWEPTMRGV